MKSETLIKIFALLLMALAVLPLGVPLLMGSGALVFTGVFALPFLPFLAGVLLLLCVPVIFTLLPGALAWRFGTITGQMADGERSPLEAHTLLQVFLGLSGVLTLCFGVGFVLLLLAFAGPARIAGFRTDGSPMVVA